MNGRWPWRFSSTPSSSRRTRTGEGSQGTILGPFYLPDSPVLDLPYELPRRPGEKGEKLQMTGRVLSADGTPLGGAVLDVWQADADGRYSGFSDLPVGLLRGKLTTDARGRLALRTIVPGAYTIPHEGKIASSRGLRLAPLAPGAHPPDRVS